MITVLDVLLYISIVILILCALAILVQWKCKFKTKRTARRNNRINPNNGRRRRQRPGNNTNTAQNTLQQEDIFNISGRVQNQENQWNAHDAYLSIEHIAATHQMNKTPHGDAPPSYEEAMRLAIAASVESAQPTAASPRAVSPTTTPPPPPPPQTENATVASTATETTVVVEPPKPSSS